MQVFQFRFTHSFLYEYFVVFVNKSRYQFWAVGTKNQTWIWKGASPYKEAVYSFIMYRKNDKYAHSTKETRNFRVHCLQIDSQVRVRENSTNSSPAKEVRMFSSLSSFPANSNILSLYKEYTQNFLSIQWLILTKVF